MFTNEKNYDISLSIGEYPQTELITVKLNNSIDNKKEHLNINNSEISSSTEFRENFDDEDDSNFLKDQFSNSVIDVNDLREKNEDKKTIKYRRGNLYIFYDKKGYPKIVIGPDCKFLFIFY